MEITRQYYEREGVYNYYFKQDNKVLEITFAGNLDLYWRLEILNKRQLSLDEITKTMYDEVKGIFVITKENFLIYTLFEELYHDIEESILYTPYHKSNINEDEEEIFYYYTNEDVKKYNEEAKERYEYKLLFNNGIIEWRSDDEDYDIADIVKIKKESEMFVLEFIRPKITEEKYTLRRMNSVCIRFRNSGSRYNPFNMIFMRMFNKLQGYNPEYHQIHFEELNYKKKKIKKKGVM